MRVRSSWAVFLAVGIVASLVGAGGCARRSVMSPPSTGDPSAGAAQRTTQAPSRAMESTGAPPAAARDFEPVFFAYDSHSLGEAARATLDRSAKLLRDKPGLRLTVEGHCDERGTAEYNLSLGELRAQVARDYLAAAGVAASRIETISYGKERPFDEGHSESAWASNRRAHLVAR